MDTKQKIYATLGILLAIGLAFQAGKYSAPSKVEVITKEVIKEVIKEVEVKNEKKNKVVTVRRTTAKDGTTTVDTTITDRGTVDTNTTVDVSKESVKVSETTISRDSGLSLQALALAPFNDLKDRVYGAAVSKRVFGNLRVGVLGTSDKKIGVSVGLDF